jgi:hypothetical protein
MEQTIDVSVMRRGEARFDMCGRKLPDSLHDAPDESISPGLLARLHRYGLKRMLDAGFEVADWRCEVYTMDADLPRSERYYCVEFTNPKGGMVGVQGVATNHGHPFLDHGLCVGEDRSR